MIKLVVMNDQHLGLKTDNVDRNPEIFEVMEQVVKAAVDYKAAGFRTILVSNGDLFNKNNPSEELIAEFIERIINPLKEHDIESYFVNGNHDSIPNPDNKSCLTFIKSIKKGYPNIHLVEDIRTVLIETNDLGPLRFSFFPDITRAHLKGTEFKSPQAYIDAKAEKLKSKLGPAVQHYIFSHLNVRGAHPGSEENLLKKSEVYVPACFVWPNVDSSTQIIQAHIHSHAIIDNIYIVGSPIYCGFGEADDDKAFAVFSVPQTFGEKYEIERIPTVCRPFKQLELDLTEWTDPDVRSHASVKGFLDSIDSRCVVKFDLKVNPQTLNVNWNEFRERIEKHYGCWVKPIEPKYIYDKFKRNKQQKLSLKPHEAVQVFLKTNKPPRIKQKWELAKQFLNA